MSKEEKNNLDYIKNQEGNLIENSDDTIYFTVYYSKKSSEEIRQILNKKILNVKIFNGIIDPKNIEEIINIQNVYFFFFNIDKKMIRALMKKENKTNFINEQIRLEWKSR
jgi:hypothetical protein